MVLVHGDDKNGDGGNDNEGGDGGDDDDGI